MSQIKYKYNENLNIPTFNGEKILSETPHLGVLKEKLIKQPCSKKDDLKENLKIKLTKRNSLEMKGSLWKDKKILNIKKKNYFFIPNFLLGGGKMYLLI